MTQLLIVIAVALVVWSLVASRLERWQVGAPVVMVLAGIAAEITTRDPIGAELDTDVARHAAEIILAVLLFVDATEVRGGRLWGRDPRAAARLLLLALPLSLGLAVALGMVLLPDLSWAAVLVIACAVVPSDFAPATSILRDKRIPARVRGLLNVESGYNDGIVSPIFLFALILAGGDSHAGTPLEALGTAVPFAVRAIVAGFVLGTVLAWLIDRAEQRGLMTERSRAVTMAVAPVLAFAITVSIDGNGFVASFVCGIAFRYARRWTTARDVRRTTAFTNDLQLLDNITFLLTMVMWFVVGAAAVHVFSFGLDWRAVLFTVAVLTVVRVGPVLIAMVRSRYTWRERLLIGTLGPRGTTSIVFGLLAYNGLTGAGADTALLLMEACVLGSVLLHGFGVPATSWSWARLDQRRGGTARAVPPDLP